VSARSAVGVTSAIRVGIIDASYDSMPQILNAVQSAYPDLEIHQVEVAIPEQYRLLAEGRLDIGFGRASLAPPEIASELFRLDPLGVLVADGHPFAGMAAVPVAMLAREPLLLAEQERSPEFNQFLVELCRSVGFTPVLYRGTVESIRASADLVLQGRCLLCVPSSCATALPGLHWTPLIEPPSRYPWSVLWRAGDRSEAVLAVVRCARALSHERDWLASPDEATG
jgi:DNA-binding transcriptional LysR family regulator